MMIVVGMERLLMNLDLHRYKIPMRTPLWSVPQGQIAESLESFQNILTYDNHKNNSPLLSHKLCAGLKKLGKRFFRKILD